MPKAPNYITHRGLRRLRTEFDDLRLVERPKIVEEVAYAAALGDRSENAEYIYGKRRLRQIDSRLRWLGRRLQAAEVIDPAVDRGDKVFFGATVTVEYPDGTERVYVLVGQDEIEAHKGHISWRSPIGRALVRRELGDMVAINHMDQHLEIEIVDVSYLPQSEDSVRP